MPPDGPAAGWVGWTRNREPASCRAARGPDRDGAVVTAPGPGRPAGGDALWMGKRNCADGRWRPGGQPGPYGTGQPRNEHRRLTGYADRDRVSTAAGRPQDRTGHAPPCVQVPVALRPPRPGNPVGPRATDRLHPAPFTTSPATSRGTSRATATTYGQEPHREGPAGARPRLCTPLSVDPPGGGVRWRCPARPDARPSPSVPPYRARRNQPMTTTHPFQGGPDA